MFVTNVAYPLFKPSRSLPESRVAAVNPIELDTSKALYTFRATVSDVVGRRVVTVGEAVGERDGGKDVGRSVVGANVGLFVGAFVVGCTVGRSVGLFEGEPGVVVGISVVGISVVG